MSLFSVSESGLITVDSSDIEESIISAYKSALGSDLNTEAGTPQGQLILNDTAMLTYAQNQAVQIANAYNVLTAKGSALDVVANFWGYYRKQAVATVASCTFTGTAGLVIPSGTLVSDGTNNFQLLTSVTISDSGTITGQVQCTESGAITVRSGDINEIVSTLSGLDSVTNETPGITGYDEELDNVFRQRITQNWFNVRARGALGAIWDNLASLDNVLSVYVAENPSNDDLTISNQTLSPHSVYIAVAGGSDDDIAKVIYNQKTIGANTNGSDTVTYTDSSTGINMTYKIERIIPSDLSVRVTYQSNKYTSNSIATQIKETLASWYNSNLVKIGGYISGAMLGQAFDDFPYADILSIKIHQASSSTLWVDYISVNIDTLYVLTEDNVSVVENG